MSTLRDEFMRLMREDFKPAPADWDLNYGWGDNAEDVADRMINAATAHFSVQPAPDADAIDLQTIAERDAAEKAMQDLDCDTGGDGEYVGGWTDRPSNPSEMAEGIAQRFAALRKERDQLKAAPAADAIRQAAEHYIAHYGEEPERDCVATDDGDGPDLPPELAYSSDWSRQEFDAERKRRRGALAAAIRARSQEPQP